MENKIEVWDESDKNIEELYIRYDENHPKNRNIDGTLKKKFIMRRGAQNQFVLAYKRNLGSVALSCEEAGINRNTYNEWYKHCESFRADIEDCKEFITDLVERSLLDQIIDKVPSSTIFYLKTKGKDRGYIENERSLIIDTININIVDDNLNIDSDSDKIE